MVRAIAAHTASFPEHQPTQPAVQAKLRGILRPELDESSGLVASRRYPGILWTHADSDGPSELYALDHRGVHVATFDIAGVDNRDWEDLAFVEIRGKPFLMIADAGDNIGVWSQSVLHFVPEPDPRYGVGSVTPVVSVAFTFEGGPVDVESAAVSSDGHSVLLLSKRTQPPVLYELPLSTRGAAVARQVTPVLAFERDLDLPFPATHASHLYYKQPTAMDLAPDGSAAYVLTYGHVFVFSRSPQQTWGEAFQGEPEILPLPPMPQAEGLAYDPARHSLFVISEGVDAPLYELPLQR